jgi:hypothetical protein
MKTEQEPDLAAGVAGVTENPEVAAATPPLLQTLLQRDVASRAAPPDRVEGIVIGRVEKIGADGCPWVVIDALGEDSLPAASLTQITAEHIGKMVALGFESANPQRPIILGLMFESGISGQGSGIGEQWAASSPEPESLRVTRKGGRTLIQARTELELRCGKAVIRLKSDGRITLRGGYITSHAEATNRIRGGSVQLN